MLGYFLRSRNFSAPLPPFPRRSLGLCSGMFRALLRLFFRSVCSLWRPLFRERPFCLLPVKFCLGRGVLLPRFGLCHHGSIRCGRALLFREVPQIPIFFHHHNP